MAEISEEVAVNPDAQSAVTDFLDYTEYLPTDLMRSLSLIQLLDETYLDHADTIHNLTSRYGNLPNVPAPERQDASKLRSDISRQLDLALNARESAYAEARRLFDLTSRHQERLQSIIGKLNALPKPPSRDPTPQPQPQNATKTSRSAKKIGTNLRLNFKKGTAAPGAPRPRGPRVTVPGEVQPPYDPDEPMASTEMSDFDSDSDSPIRPTANLKALKRSTTESDRKSREKSTYPRPSPPPQDAPVGSKYAPWTRLTEYEMYRLRKKMKKNHEWEPSEVMIKRELAEKGRGWDNYMKARAAAIASGAPFIDEDTGEKSPAGRKSDRPKVRRSESKKEKKEDVSKAYAVQAANEQELAARKLSDIGATFKNLFGPLSNAWASLASPAATPKTEKPPKKRKLEEAVSLTPASETEGQPKKRPKIAPKPSSQTLPDTAVFTTPAATTIKLKLPNTAPPGLATRSASTSKLPKIEPKLEPSPPPASRPSSRRSAAASVEPASTRQSRRTSTTPAVQTRKITVMESPKDVETLASRRSRREPPGTVTQSSQDGGAAVSSSKRKHKPGKASKVQVADDIPDLEVRTDVDGNREILDPDEERYCVCGDVSYGEMICCELDEQVRTLPKYAITLLTHRSARLDSGFIWTAYICTVCHHEPSSGIALAIGRNYIEARPRMVSSAALSNSQGQPRHV